jgi:iron complex transport system permease protein
VKTRYYVILAVILSLISLFIGNIEISISDIADWNREKLDIFALTRIPRLLSVVLTGVGMSISGLIMQHISRNKFVSPTTGASVDSANLGLLTATIFFSSYGYAGSLLLTAVFSLLGTFTFILILRKAQLRNVVMAPLLGIMLGGVIQAIATFLAYRYDMVQSLNAWMIGSFTWVIKGRFELLYLSIPLAALAFIYANRFTIAGMGEDISTNLGVNYLRVVNIGLVIVSLVTASVVVIVGSVPFLDLIIPNLISIQKGDNLRRTIWDTALVGVVFLLACDIFSRLIIYPYEIPIGLTVGTAGCLGFLTILLRRREE